MNKKVVSTLSLCISLFLALICAGVGAQSQTNEIETFFDSKIPGIRIQVNATSITRPTEGITFNLSITPDVQAEIKITFINLTIYGFKNGTDKVKIYTNCSRNFDLTKTEIYSDSFYVPERVWGVAYGEVVLDYNVTVTDQFGKHQYTFQDIILGFTMTRIENVYLKSLEEQLANLQNMLKELNQTFMDCFGKNLTRDELLDLNQTLRQLQQDYETLKGVKSELDNTRTAVVFLAVVAVFFVVTTAYLALRKPKGYL
ncbi:MAG: hypothetical protein QXO34_00915 [Candidatus Bathyarchaeia archaeon]